MSRYRAVLRIAMSIASMGIVLSSPLLPAVEQKVVRPGFVAAGSPSAPSARFNEFWNRLHELRWVEGQNLVVERRWAARHDQLREI